MAAVSWTMEAVESSGRTKCMNPQKSHCSCFLFVLSPVSPSPSESVFFHHSAPRHISPEQHKQFSHSLCLVSDVFCLLMRSSAVMHASAAAAAFLNGSRQGKGKGRGRRRFGRGM